MQNKLNLLFITYTHSNGGGAEAVLTTLVNNLDPKKYNITIQEIDSYKTKIEPLNSNIVLQKMALRRTDWKYFDLLAPTNLFFLHNNPAVLRSVFDWNGFDVVISWNYQLPSFVLLAFDDEIKISHFHGSVEDLDIKINPENKEIYERQVKVWNEVNKISTISSLSEDSILKICPQFKNKISIVHNGSNIEYIKKNALAPLEKNILSLPDKSVKLISMGRLEKNKNQVLVLQALNILNKKGLEFEYILLGKGECEEELRKKTREYGLCNKVHFMGHIQNPYPYLQDSDILCMSSVSEGWPTVVVEAMALGKTFVTTPVAGAGYELANNETCGLVADYSAEDYAAKLERLILDKNLRETLGRNGQEHIKNFGIERNVEEFEALLKDAKKITSKRKFIDELKNKFIYCFVLTIGIADPILTLKSIRQNILFPKKSFSHFLKICARFVKFFLSIIAIPVLFPLRAILGIAFCASPKNREEMKKWGEKCV